MLFRRILQLLRRLAEDNAHYDVKVAAPDLDRTFSSTQNCDVKVSAARSSDIEMVPPNQR